MRRFGGLALAFLAVILAPLLGRTALRAQETPDQLQQLVAPIALYPDQLVAETLAASTFTQQVDDATQWLKQNASLSSDQVEAAVNQMAWDPSIKALCEFPGVLAMMDQNLSWTSTLGDAYFNQPDDVMGAVQALRQRAMAAGTLQSNAQVRVTVTDGMIDIEPASADMVYVPSYDDWAVYGAPITPWPEFVFASGIVAGPHVRWDIGIRIGGGWGSANWGWRNWSPDWAHHQVVFNRAVYVSHSPSVVDHHFVARPEVVAPERGRPSPVGRAVAGPRPAVVGPKPQAPPKAQADHQADRGFPQATSKPAAPPSGTHTTVFTAVNHGGVAAANSARGQASMGGHSTPPRPSGGRGRS
jgi:hypothetical protein